LELTRAVQVKPGRREWQYPGAKQSVTRCSREVQRSEKP